MDAQLENCIKTKRYDELTTTELSVLSIYFTNEAEFNLLKDIYTCPDLDNQTDSHPDLSVKAKLDNLFDETYPSALKGANVVSFKRFKYPLLYLAAASLIFFVSYLFKELNDNNTKKVVKVEKQKEPILKTKENKTIIPAPPVTENKKIQLATIKSKAPDYTIESSELKAEDISLVENGNSLNEGSFQFDYSIAAVDDESRKDGYLSPILITPLAERPDMLDVLFTAY